MTSSPFAQTCKELYQTGYSPIPLVKGDKMPLLDNWSASCTKRMSPSELKEYIKKDGLNIGVALGPASGIIALDFDDDLNGLHEKIRSIVPESPVVKVGGKGFTAFYRYNGEKNRSWKLKHEGKKYTIVELLSEGRQTVVPPSVHPSGEAYKYTTMDGLADIALEELPELPKDFNRQVDKLLGVEDEDESPRVTLPIEDLKDALTYIDAGDYEDWVRCGMAIKVAYPDEEGFAIWDEWSATSDKYDEKAMKPKWKSFKRAGISLGTLVYLAMQEGWDCKTANEELKKEVMSHFITLDQVEDELDSLRDAGKDNGTPCDIPLLSNHLNFRKGELTIVSGYSNAGKSEFLDSVAVSLMQSRDDWRIAIASMEKGYQKHFDDLVHKVARKPRKDMTVQEYRDAKAFLRKHVTMVDYYSIKRDFKSLLMNIRRLYKFEKIDSVIIDPFNLLKTKYKNTNLMAHASMVVDECVSIAKELDLHVFLVAHPTKPSDTFLKDFRTKDGRLIKGKIPKMSEYSISGGADMVNIPDNIVIVSRNEDGTTGVDIRKVRDQEVDTTGSFVLQYDKYSRGYGLASHRPEDDEGEY